MTIANRNIMLEQGQNLPYDAEVAYLEGTGTQYIDTGVNASSSMSVITRVAWSEVGYDKTAIGVDNGSTFNGGFNLQVTVGGSYFRFIRGSQYVDARGNNNLPPQADTFYDISIGPEGMEINGTLSPITATTSFTTVGTLPLFAWRRSYNLLGCAKVKIGRTKIYEGDVLVIDLIPVRFTNELGQSEGAMYDRANQTVGMNPDGSARDDGIYRNRGTGAFLIGPDTMGGGANINA